MSILTWRKEPPDSEGVWAFSRDGVNFSGVTFYESKAVWVDHYYCRIGDVPVIEQAVKYRTPTAADVGRNCEFKPDPSGEYKPARVAGFLSDGEMLVEYKRNCYRRMPNEARIVDDGKAELVEGWVNLYGDRECDAFYHTKESADACAASCRLRCVRVREVID